MALTSGASVGGAPGNASAQGKSMFFSARDGLRLHARVFEAPGSLRRPVLCLAGLTRNSRDFIDIAVALSSGPEARPVYALDSRGRGLSEFDPDWRNYAIPIEMQDVIDFTTVAGLHGVSVIGTSRGGIITMVLAAAQPTLLGAVVLNDIGPVIELDGLARISGYAARMPLPGSWKDAAGLVAGTVRGQFPAVTPQQWEEVARAWFNEKDGKPAPGYDGKIGKSISIKNGPVPQLWPQFLALSCLPTLVVRGAQSDILSVATLSEMLRRHPDCASLVVPQEGHAPLLKDRITIAAIARFLAAAEAAERVSGRDFGQAAAG